MLFWFDVIFISIIRRKWLVACPTESRFVLKFFLLFLRLEVKFSLKFLFRNWWKFSYFSFQVISVPVSFVMISLDLCIRENYTTGQACVWSHVFLFSELYLMMYVSGFFMRPKTSLPDHFIRFCQQPSQGSTEKLGDEFFSCNFADYTLFFSELPRQVLIHSHKKRKDSLETRAVFSWTLILTWNFGGGRGDSASTFFKIASASWFWCY